MAEGVFFLVTHVTHVTHVTSIAALVLYDPIFNDPDYIVGSGADNRVRLGAVLEGILAMAIIGTAVTLFPIVRRQNESFALGYVGLRTLEASTIAVGIVTLLAIVTMRQERVTAADANPDTLNVSVGPGTAVRRSAGARPRPAALSQLGVR